MRAVAWIFIGTIAWLLTLGLGYKLGVQGREVVFRTVEVPMWTPCPKPKKRPRAMLRQVERDWRLSWSLRCWTEQR